MNNNKKTIIDKKIGFKAYFFTCFLLSKFEGLHSMIAEQELYEWTVDLLMGDITKAEYVENIYFTFGLKKTHVDKAGVEFREYLKERSGLNV